jgi:hypothetical protein
MRTAEEQEDRGLSKQALYVVAVLAALAAGNRRELKGS